jgi:hypothetical protein
VDADPDSETGSRSGSKRAKMTHKMTKASSVAWTSFVLYGGLGITNFLFKKYEFVFLALIFLIFGHENP